MISRCQPALGASWGRRDAREAANGGLCTEDAHMATHIINPGLYNNQLIEGRED